MNLHYFQHVPFEGPASLESWATSRKHKIASTRFYAGDPIPRLNQLDWLVIMGGPMSIHDETENPWLIREKHFIAEAIKANKVVIGICLGAQLVAHALGSEVYRNPTALQEKQHGDARLVRPASIGARLTQHSNI